MIFDRLDPDTPVYKIFEISALFAKAPPHFDPKIDPYKWPIENVIHNKNPLLLLQWWGQHSHILWCRGADRSDRKS
jgi:hypothetical protein